MALPLVIAVLTGSPSPTGDGVRFLPGMETLVFVELGLFFAVGLLQLVYAIAGHGRPAPCRDRKSTRLNSSHVAISYADFCLKKKKKYNNLNKIKVPTPNQNNQMH